jgi:rod shape-determining protein MreC
LGEVIQVEHDPGQPFAYVKAKPSAYLDRSRYVLLVFSMESEMPTAVEKQEPES